MLLAAVTFTVFLGVALLSYSVLALTFSDDRRVSRRLSGLTEYERAQARQATPMLRPFRERVASPVASWLSRVAHAIWPADYRKRIAQRLERAGHPGGMDIARFMSAKFLVALGMAMLLGVVALFVGWGIGSLLLLVIVAGVFGLFVPDLWLTNHIARRQHAIVRSLPDMLDMLTISVQAGLGFDAALSKLVRNTQGPLAEEFGRMLQEVQAGASRKVALRHMAERVDVPELSTFTAAIVQADMFGISIAQVLRTQAAEMRLRRRQRAEEEAQKAPVKMVVPLVLCILPATIIVVVGPAALRIAAAFGG